MERSNLILLPGLIDVHTHCRQPGAEHKETLKTATMAALAGGFTTILDMPNCPIPTLSPTTLKEKMKLAKGNIYVDIGFNFGANRESSQFFNEVAGKTFANKLYMNETTGNLLVDDPSDQEEVFRRCPDSKIIMIHGEGQTLSRAIQLSRQFGKRIHICHVSLVEEVEMIRNAKEEGLPITAEATPHHLFLTRGDEKALGAYGMMRPPLASYKDQDALWDGLGRGVIDIIASDHAPHTKEEKESANPPAGVPGLETTLPLMLTAVSGGRISIDGKHGLLSLLYRQPKQIFGITPPPETTVFIDPKKEFTIDSSYLYTKCGWTPFDGFRARGQIVKVVYRGQTVLENGRIKEGPLGRVICPNV